MTYFILNYKFDLIHLPHIYLNLVKVKSYLRILLAIFYQTDIKIILNLNEG